MSDEIFDKFWEQARPHHGEHLRADVTRGAAWHEPASGRTLCMDTVSRRRMTAEQFAALVKDGTLVKDGVPLSETVEIWVTPSKRTVVS